MGLAMASDVRHAPPALVLPKSLLEGTSSTPTILAPHASQYTSLCQECISLLHSSVGRRPRERDAATRAAKRRCTCWPFQFSCEILTDSCDMLVYFDHYIGISGI